MDFTGKLNANEIFASIYNMIISQQVFADNIHGTFSNLVDKARTEGTLFGDSKLFYATDCLGSEPWGNDAEALNLLRLHRPQDPECQVITLDVFRQIALTVDNYLSKRAWGTEGAFSDFTSVMTGWIGDTKRIYDSTTYNTYIGTTSTTKGKQNQVIKLSGIAETGEAKTRAEAMVIAEHLANLLVDMTDVSRDFNDYGNLRSYSKDQIMVVWNSKYFNKIRKIDLPTIFHSEGLVDKLGQEVLPARYFGKEVAGGTANGTQRSLIEKDYNKVARDNPAYVKNKHVFPGDIIPTGETFGEHEAYVEDPKIICKVFTKLPPYMSSFEVGTSFFNPKSLTENRYLTFGRNTIQYLENYPLITISADK